jgi:hypothetical protein
MTLNPYFLHGSNTEQRLVQDLINEQLRMFGVEVTYIPRKFVNTKTIIEEVQASKFDDNFQIEAYVGTYEGFTGAGDILTKFGMSLRDDVTLIISKERYEEFIAPFLTDDPQVEVPQRPSEGDLIYFPLGNRLFEIKFVEHEKPFYQLGKTYIYELQCELFEYEDEIIDTSIESIDTLVADQGYIATMNLIGLGRTADFTAVLGAGYIDKIYLNDDGYGFTSTPTVVFDPSPTNIPDNDAKAVAITTTRGGVTSIDKIYLTFAGVGYTTIPSITFTGGGGSGAAATCSINSTGDFGVVSFVRNDGGTGYGAVPSVTVSTPDNGNNTATGIASISYDGTDSYVTNVYITNAGSGYIGIPTVTISNPDTILGIGTYQFNEVIKGSRSFTTARVNEFDLDNYQLKISNLGIGGTIKGFYPGETVIGQSSGAEFVVRSITIDDLYDKYAQNDEIELEADGLIDFTESNPFGNY